MINFPANFLQRPKRFHLHTVSFKSEISSRQLFQAIYAQKNPVIWLDSSQVNMNFSRFSLMGDTSGFYSYQLRYFEKNAQVILDYKGESHAFHEVNFFDFLNRLLEEKVENSLDVPFHFFGGLVGYLGYELKASTCGIKLTKLSDSPDAQFIFLDRFILIDHLTSYVYLVCLDKHMLSASNVDWFQEIKSTLLALKPRLTELPAIASKRLRSNLYDFYKRPNQNWLISPQAYLNKIKQALKAIYAGESYEICLTNKLYKIIPGFDLLDYYYHLRQQSPAPYSAFLRLHQIAVACSSMERFLKADVQGRVETCPIKGTMPRGKNLGQDRKYRDILKQSEKFYSENLMIVDLLRNDLNKVCQIGSVQVPNMMRVETYATLHQLVSTVQGDLKPGVTAVDCMKVAFPGGSITGAPKYRTLEIIDSLEAEARGIYTGAIGYFSLNGAMDFNIVIRTVVQEENRVSMGVGGAIIALSNPEEECQELMVKSKGLLRGFESLLNA